MSDASFVSSFSGKTIDDAIAYLHSFNAASIGWKKLFSIPLMPYDLDTIMDKGNYYIQYPSNVPEDLKECSVNVCAYHVNNILHQSINHKSRFFRRSYDETTTKWSDWTEVSTDGHTIYRLPAEPTTSEVGDIWINTEPFNPSINVKTDTGWVEVTDTGYMGKDPYDTSGLSGSITDITNSEIGNVGSILEPNEDYFFDNKTILSRKYSAVMVDPITDWILTLYVDNIIAIHSRDQEYIIDTGKLVFDKLIPYTYQSIENQSDSVESILYFLREKLTNAVYIGKFIEHSETYPDPEYEGDEEPPMLTRYWYTSEFTKCTVMTNAIYIGVKDRIAIIVDRARNVYTSFAFGVWSVQKAALDTSYMPYDFAFGKGTLVLVGSMTGIHTKLIYLSKNLGKTWESKELPTTGLWGKCVYLKDKFLICQNGVLASGSVSGYITTDLEAFTPDPNKISNANVFVYYGRVYFHSNADMYTLKSIADLESTDIVSTKLYNVTELKIAYYPELDSTNYNRKLILPISSQINQTVTYKVAILQANPIYDSMPVHINNEELHTNNDNRYIYNNKVTEKIMTDNLDALRETLFKYGRDKIDRTTIPKILENLTNDEDLLNRHIINTDMHITLSERSRWNSKAKEDHTHNMDGRVEIDGSDVIGVFDYKQLPTFLFNKTQIVRNDEERFELSPDKINNGDIINVYENPVSEISPFISLTKNILSIGHSYNADLTVKEDDVLYGGSNSYIRHNGERKDAGILGNFNITSCFRNLASGYSLYTTDAKYIIYHNDKIDSYKLIETSEVITKIDMCPLVNPTEQVLGSVKTIAVGAMGGLFYIVATKNNDDFNFTIYTATITNGINSDALRSFAFNSDDPSIAIAVGDNGAILRTTNYGNTWYKVTTNYTYNFTDVTYCDGKFIIISMNGRVIYSTEDTYTDWLTALNVPEGMYTCIDSRVIDANDVRYVIGTSNGNYLVLNKNLNIQDNINPYHNLVGSEIPVSPAIRDIQIRKVVTDGVISYNIYAVGDTYTHEGKTYEFISVDGEMILDNPDKILKFIEKIDYINTDPCRYAVLINDKCMISNDGKTWISLLFCFNNHGGMHNIRLLNSFLVVISNSIYGEAIIIYKNGVNLLMKFIRSYSDTTEVTESIFNDAVITSNLTESTLVFIGHTKFVNKLTSKTNPDIIVNPGESVGTMTSYDISKLETDEAQIPLRYAIIDGSDTKLNAIITEDCNSIQYTGNSMKVTGYKGNDTVYAQINGTITNAIFDSTDYGAAYTSKDWYISKAFISEAKYTSILEVNDTTPILVDIITDKNILTFRRNATFTDISFDIANVELRSILSYLDKDGKTKKIICGTNGFLAESEDGIIWSIRNVNQDVILTNLNKSEGDNIFTFTNGDNVIYKLTMKDIVSKYYIVQDNTKLNSEEGYYQIDNGIIAGSTYWEKIINLPTTIEEFGITDAFSKSEIDKILADKSGEVNTNLNNILVSRNTTVFSQFKSNYEKIEELSRLKHDNTLLVNVCKEANAKLSGYDLRAVAIPVTWHHVYKAMANWKEVSTTYANWGQLSLLVI